MLKTINSFINLKETVALIGIILTFLVGLFNLLQTKRKTYIDNVTANRVEWMNVLKKYISELMKITNLKNIGSIVDLYDEPNKIIELRENLTELSTLIKLHLNYKGDIDKRILSEVSLLVNLTNSAIFLKKILKILKSDEELKRQEDFKDYILDIPDRFFINLLLEYSIKHNPSTILEKSDKHLDFKSLKEKILDDFESMRAGVCFLDEFCNKDKEVINDIIIKTEKHKFNIIKLTQIYLKAEWTRVKKETKSWPWNIYSEKKIISLLEKEYSNCEN